MGEEEGQHKSKRNWEQLTHHPETEICHQNECREGVVWRAQPLWGVQDKNLDLVNMAVKSHWGSAWCCNVLCILRSGDSYRWGVLDPFFFLAVGRDMVILRGKNPRHGQMVRLRLPDFHEQWPLTAVFSSELNQVSGKSS